MPQLSPGKPVTSKTPELLVENKLEAGRYRFELVVVDESGLESAPAELVVSVQAKEAAKETVVTKPVPVTPIKPVVLKPVTPVLKPVVTAVNLDGRPPVKPK